MNFSEIKFQYYPALIKSTTPKGIVSLKYFLSSIKNPKPETLEIFKQIELAEIADNMKLKSELKQNNLFFFTPCVHLKNRRRYSDIVSYTGLIPLDFDHIDNAEEFKEYVFNEYPFIIAAWLSPSRRGVKCLVKIPIALTLDEFKEYYFALEEIFECFNGFDPTTKNAVLPLFQSYDFDLLIRDNPETFSKRKIDKKDFKSDPVRNCIPYPADKKEALILKIADTGINKIQAPGHPQLRSICISLGGYIASGYVDLQTVLSRVDFLIECNGYLKKGIEGYKKTARWAIEEGRKKPIRLN